MRALVTGGRGFVGTWLVRHLVALGHDVRVLDRDEADIRDAAAVESIVAEAAPDVVFHLAAQASVARSLADPFPTFEVNVMGTVNVLEAVKRRAAKARVIVASSAEVYGIVGEDALPITEDAPLAPVNPYAASKVAQEAVALAYHRGSGLDVIVTRSFNTIGPGQSTDFALPSFAARLAAIVRGEAPPVLEVGNLDVERDFTDVRDAARAYALLAERGAAGACTIFARVGSARCGSW